VTECRWVISLASVLQTLSGRGQFARAGRPPRRVVTAAKGPAPRVGIRPGSQAELRAKEDHPCGPKPSCSTPRKTPNRPRVVTLARLEADCRAGQTNTILVERPDEVYEHLHLFRRRPGTSRSATVPRPARKRTVTISSAAPQTFSVDRLEDQGWGLARRRVAQPRATHRVKKFLTLRQRGPVSNPVASALTGRFPLSAGPRLKAQARPNSGARTGPAGLRRGCVPESGPTSPRGRRRGRRGAVRRELRCGGPVGWPSPAASSTTVRKGRPTVRFPFAKRPRVSARPLHRGLGAGVR